MVAMTVGIDLAKSVFQVHGVDSSGEHVLRRRLSRGRLLDFFAQLPPCRIGMEACASAHHWARELMRLGHDVRLIPPQYVKPYVKRNKTDAADAEAICEAVSRPNMRFVPVKTVDQQAVLALHRARSLLVRQRTQLANAIRGLLGEFGIVVPKGIRRLSELRQRAAGTAADRLPDEARSAVTLLFRQLEDTQEQIGAVEAGILAWHARSEVSQRLATAPGIGPITATALVAAVGDARQFASARRFAAWLGLTPRVTASGGKEKLGKISKAGDRYLRTLLIHGARGLVGGVAPAIGDATALAAGAGSTPTCERRGDGPGAQDRPSGVGDADPPGGLAGTRPHGRGVAGRRPTRRRRLAGVKGADGGTGRTGVDSSPRTMRATSSSICPAVDPRRPSRPAAVLPRFKAGYTTASAGACQSDPKDPLQREGGPYTSFCSSRMAPTRRVMAASLGKMPTTSVRRLISPLTRSSGLVEWILARCSLGKAHVGEHVLLGLVQQRGELGQLGPDLVGDLAPLGLGGVGMVLGEGGGDEGRRPRAGRSCRHGRGRCA